ncbi:MAG: NAD(P)/FAD-dependent oxidoreductase [Pseudomonadota bacterium]
MSAPRIGIVGAGTAGLAAAIAFARLGYAVTVFEKHPGLASVGAGLLIQPQGLDALDALGLGEAFDAVSVPIDHLFGSTHRDWTIVDIPYRINEARGVSRSALAAVLLPAAQAAGVELRFGAPVERVEVDGALAHACIDESRHTFELLILANGAASPLPAAVGLAVAAQRYSWGALWGMFDVEGWQWERRLEQRYRGTERMFGLMPTERVGSKMRLSLFWSLPCDAYSAWQGAPLQHWKDELLALWPASAPVLNQITRHDQLTFASYYHAHATSLAKPPVCVIGDAAHAMSPQLGLGSTFALQDALLLAAQVERNGVERGALAFSKQRLRTVRAYQGLSRLLTPCFQAHGTGLWRDLLFAGSLFVPGTRQLMYRGVAQPRARQRARQQPKPALG